MAKPLSFLQLLIFFLLSSPPCPPVLAFSTREQKHFHRPDPLRGLKPYNGSYDIQNKHYWASAAFTGVHGLAMAGIWILAGLAAGIFLARSKKKAESSLGSKCHPHLLITLAFLLTALILVVSGIAIAKVSMFHGKVQKLEATLFGAIGASYRAMNTVVHAIEKIQHLACPYYDALCELLTSASVELRTSSRDVHRVLHEDRHLLDKFIELILGITVGTISLNLLLVIVAIGVIIWHWHPGLIMYITGTHMYFLVLGNFRMLDYNISFLDAYRLPLLSSHDFITNPSNNSLSAVIPCPNSALADSTMVEIGFGVHTFITQLNSNIKEELKKIGIEAKQLGFTRGPFEICDPFADAPNYNYNPSKCSKEEISIINMINVVNMNKPLFSERSYGMILASAYSVQELTSALSDLERLLHCSYLIDAFDNVHSLQCGPLRQCILLLWSLMLLISISMMALEVSWIVKALQDRRLEDMALSQT